MKKIFKSMNYTENKVWNLLCGSWYFTHVLWCQCKYTVWIELLPQTRVKNAKQLAALCCPFLFGKALIFGISFTSQVSMNYHYIYSNLLYIDLLPAFKYWNYFIHLKIIIECGKQLRFYVACDFCLGFYISTDFVSVFVLFHCSQVDFTSVWNRSLQVSWLSYFVCPLLEKLLWKRKCTWRMFVYIMQKLWLFTLIAFVFNLDFFGGIPVCHRCWRVKMQFCVFVDFCCN